MSEMKSAWELAQERANRLGKLSAQEKEEQERQTYSQIGRALAHKLMNGFQNQSPTTASSTPKSKLTFVAPNRKPGVTHMTVESKSGVE